MQTSIACPSEVMFEKLRHGQLPLPNVEEVARHLETCQQCVTTVQKLRIEDELATSLESNSAWQEPAPDPLLEELMQRLYDAGPALGAGSTNSSDSGTFPESQDAEADAGSLAGVGFEELGQYRIRTKLGAGAMGIVFEAEDVLLRRSVALKVMRPRIAARTEARQRFLREARAAAAVKHRTS